MFSLFIILQINWILFGSGSFPALIFILCMCSVCMGPALSLFIFVTWSVIHYLGPGSEL